MNQNPKSKSLFEKASAVIPGGVNSPVRAFRAVGGTPLFMKRASGAYLYDEDGHAYIDLISSWGPMILGHAHPAVGTAVAEAIKDSLTFGAPSWREVEMAEQICKMVPSIEKVRMVNSGTEATMSAVRLARGFTGRNKIIKMEGCYHGHGDSFLIAAGSGAITFGVPDSPGVTKGTAQDTLLAPFNEGDAVETLLDTNQGAVAAIILEPVVGNMGCVLPEPGYLQRLRELCDKHGTLLIFDEVMTGFRLAPGGAQEVFNVRPDLTTLGKIIGGGMPVGAYGGRKDVMEFVSPSGPVYQAGTLSGNPIAMAAGLALLRELDTHREIYGRLDLFASRLVSGIKDQLRKYGIAGTVNHIGSMFTLFFTHERVNNFDKARLSNLDFYKKYFHSMLNRGVYLAPSQFEALFVSASIDYNIIERILKASDESLAELL